MKKGSQLLQSRAMINNVEEQNQMSISVAKQKQTLMKTKLRALSCNWQLHDRMRHLNAIHERQQGYLVDIQMQYEELDGKHRDDLALREVQQNTFKSTGDMFKILCVSSNNSVLEQGEEILKGKKEIERSCKTKQDTQKVDNSFHQHKEYRKMFVQDYEIKKKEEQRANEEWAERVNKDRKETYSNLEFIKKHADNDVKLEAEKKQRVQVLLQAKEEVDILHEQNSHAFLEIEEEIKEQKKSAISDMEAVTDRHENMIKEKRLEKASHKTALVNQENFTEIIFKKTKDTLEELTQMEREASQRKEYRNKAMKALQMKWEELESKIAKDNLEIKEREKMKNHFDSGMKLMHDQIDTLKESLKVIDSKSNLQRDQWKTKINDLTSEFEELKSLDDETRLELHKIDEETDLHQNKLTKFEELAKENSKTYAEQTSEVNRSIEFHIKELAEINDTTKQIESELNNITEKMTILKEANQTRLQHVNMKRNELLMAQETQKRVEGENETTKKNLEMLSMEIARARKQVGELTSQITTKNRYCDDQLNAWNEEKATLSSECEKFNKEILKNNKLSEENEALAQERKSVLEDQIRKRREKYDQEIAEKKTKLADLQTQKTANVNHLSDLGLQLNQVREAQVKSTVTRDNKIREIATSNAELQAIKDDIIRTNEDKHAHTQAVNNKIKSITGRQEETVEELTYLKDELQSISGTSKPKKRRNKMSALNLPAEGRQSPVLGSNPGPQEKSPRLLKNKDKKKVKFASPEIAPSPVPLRAPPLPPPVPLRAPPQPRPDRSRWDYYSDSSDGGGGAYADKPLLRAFAVPSLPPPPPPPPPPPLPRLSAAEAPPATLPSLSPRETYDFLDEEPPTKDTKESELALPTTPRRNKFFSSRRPNQQFKRLKLSDN